MDQAAAGVETFVLKTNIYSRAREIEMEQLLQEIEGVHRIAIDPKEIGKVTILGTIDPRKVMKILWKKNRIKSEQVFEPMTTNRRDLPNVTIDKEAVEGLEALSKLKTFESVDLTRNGMKLKYKKDESVQHLDGKNGSCSRNMHENGRHKNGEHMMNNYYDFHGNYESYYCHGCGTNRGYVAPHEGISIGIPAPVPEYIIPSAPPLPAEDDPVPRSQEQYYDTISSSDDNPTGVVFFFILFFLILLIQGALS